jgi:hypothetical protein
VLRWKRRPWGYTTSTQFEDEEEDIFQASKDGLEIQHNVKGIAESAAADRVAGTK